MVGHPSNSWASCLHVCWCCCRLFVDGVINWGRIIVLLCFGYRVVMASVRRGLRVVFTQLVQFVVRFFVNENIVHWLAAHGGWVSTAHAAAGASRFFGEGEGTLKMDKFAPHLHF